MQLTVLGAGPACPNPGGACSGYLVSANRSHVLLDCGPGVVGRLLQAVPLRELDGVVISHMHQDHFMDLAPLVYGVTLGGFRGERRLPVLVPPGGASALAEIGRALSGNPKFFSDVYDLNEYDPESVIDLGAYSVSFRRVAHFIPAYAMRIHTESPADGVLTYSGDTGPCDELVEHARGANTLLCEAALRRQEEADPRRDPRGHTSPREAGEMARRAGVKRLLLTHHWVDVADPDYGVREAASSFGGPLELVREGQRHTI